MVRSGETIGLVEQLSWRAIKVRTMEGNTILDSQQRRPAGSASRSSGAAACRWRASSASASSTTRRRPGPARSSKRPCGTLPGLAAYPAPSRPACTSFDDFAVVYELRYWLDDYARYIEIDSAVRERVWYALYRERIAIAYP